MHNNTYSYNGKKVPIARIDSSKKLSFMQQEGLVFSDLPRIVVGFNG
jgi:hypothetical protein